MNKPSKLTTAVAFLMTALFISVAYIWKTYHIDAPFETYGVFMLILCGGYTGKRLATRLERFGGSNAKNPNGSTGNGPDTVSDVSLGQQKD